MYQTTLHLTQRSTWRSASRSMLIGSKLQWLVILAYAVRTCSSHSPLLTPRCWCIIHVGILQHAEAWIFRARRGGQEAMVSFCVCIIIAYNWVAIHRHAWNNLGSMSHDDAVDGFLGVIEEIQPDWEQWPGFPTPGADDLTEEQLKQATTRIQTHFRKFSAQKTAEQERVDANAASKIQSVIRGKSARSVANERRAEAAQQVRLILNQCTPLPMLAKCPICGLLPPARTRRVESKGRARGAQGVLASAAARNVCDEIFHEERKEGRAGVMA
jgi:hypothetical protein